MTGGARVLFVDLDGTLADSIGAMYDVYRAFVEKRGGQADPSEFEELNGPSLREVVTSLARTHGIAGETESLYREYIEMVDRAYAESVKPNPGAGNVINVADKLGMSLVLVTANHRGAARAFLGTHGWLDRFDVLVTGDDIATGKPDPAVYRFALAAAHVEDPADAVAIEDSVNGIRAATGAGVPTIALRSDGVAPFSSDLIVACIRDLHGASAFLRRVLRV